MKITICYLYHDLLNLYGENGNVKALYKHLSNQNIDVNIKYVSINDKKEFDKYDVIYIGSGTNDNLMLALNDLINYKDDLEKYINDNKFILSTGNSIELFGDYILNDNKKTKCLGLINYYTKYNDLRIVKDVKHDNKYIKYPIIGFENHYGSTIGINDNFIEKNNFLGTYVIGPLLIRNPYFCKYYINKIIKSKDKNFKIINDDYNLEIKAYEEEVLIN